VKKLKSQAKIANPSIKGMSCTRNAGENWIGLITVTIPRTKRILRMLLPKIVPIARCGFFRKRATKEAANSGREDPIARMVNPTTRPEILNLSAKPTAPFTKI